MPSSFPAQPDTASKHLVLVTHEFFPHHGGIAVYAAEMAKAAVTTGYHIEVWAPALPPEVTEPNWPFAVKRLPLRGDHSVRSQWRMALHLINQRRKLRQATLYVPEPGPLLSMLLLQYFDALRPARLLLTFHGSEIQRLASRRILRWSTNHLLRKATGVSVVSQYARELLIGKFPAASQKVVFTPGALRTDLAPPGSATCRPEESRRIIILTVARINPRKGQLEVIKALKTLPASLQSGIEYWLVGSHSKEGYDSLLNEAAADAGFHIKFLGDIPDDKLGDIYRRADIFAMTSMPHKHSVEGFGLVYLEAGGYGLPIVAHDIGGVPEAVVNEQTGLLVKPDDPAALARAFSRLISDPDLRRRLGAAGRIHALKNSWLDSARALFGQPGPDTLH